MYNHGQSITHKEKQRTKDLIHYLVSVMVEVEVVIVVVAGAVVVESLVIA